MNTTPNTVRTLLCALALAGSCFLFGVEPGYAGNHSTANSLQRPQSDGISRERAASIAADATGGRVLSASRKGNTYLVKVLLDGERIRTVRVDARTGKVRN